MAAKIFITGASGRLGNAVFQKIKAVPLVRKASGLENELIIEFADLEKTLAHADVIIHIAGKISYDMKELEESNVELTRKIVEAAPDSAKIIFAGSISVYGKNMKEIPADEETPVNPDSGYARTKYEAEKIVRKHPKHVILRVGTIYGPQFEDFPYVIRKIEEGKMRMIGNGKNRMPLVHVDDVADVFVNAIRKGQGTYVVCGESLPQEKIFGIVSNELGVEKPKPIAKTIAFWAARIAGLKARITGERLKMTLEHVRILGSDREFDCRKAKEELGFKPRPLKKGIVDMVKKYKS